MKRFGNLYEKIYSIDNLMLAHKNASKGKSRYSEVKKVNKHLIYYIEELHNTLKDKKFVTSPYDIFTKVCGKKVREIYKLPYYPDRIVHHAIMQVVGDIWRKSFIAHTYACVKGRGIHRAVTKIKHILATDKSRTEYCLKLDITKFYPSVDNTIMKSIIRKKIKCKDTLNLLDEIIDSTKGIPVGNYLSQYLGNLYLTKLDHYCKEDLGIKYYFRYCDDIVILAEDKDTLREYIPKLRQFLHTNLNLKIKDNYQIFPTDSRGVDFLGYVFRHKYCLLRKSIAKKFKSCSLRSLPSYIGWLKYANSYNLKVKYVTVHGLPRHTRLRKLLRTAI